MRASSSGGSYGNYANVWCKNETDSLIKSGVVKYFGTGTKSEHFENERHKSSLKKKHCISATKIE